MKSSKAIAVSITAALLVLAAGRARASSITWGAAETAAAESDVRTDGHLLYAYNVGNTGSPSGSTLINGVPFQNVGITSGMTGWGAYGNQFGAPVGLSANYTTMMSSAAENATKLTLTGLNPGDPYLVEIWADDSRAGNNTRTETLSTPGGNTVTLQYGIPVTGGYNGQFAVGTFIADAPTQDITFTAAIVTHLDGYLVLDTIPEPSVMMLIGVGSLLLWRLRSRK